MENVIVLMAVTTIAVALGFWLKSQQGSINQSRFDKNRILGLTSFEDLGRNGTLVQFSTKFCAICPSTKKLLQDIARNFAGINFIEIDAENNLDLTKKLSIFSTPTVLILDSAGKEIGRFSGKPNREKITDFIWKNLELPQNEKSSA